MRGIREKKEHNRRATLNFLKTAEKLNEKPQMPL